MISASLGETMRGKLGLAGREGLGGCRGLGSGEDSADHGHEAVALKLSNFCTTAEKPRKNFTDCCNVFSTKDFPRIAFGEGEHKNCSFVCENKVQQHKKEHHFNPRTLAEQSQFLINTQNRKVSRFFFPQFENRKGIVLTP